MDDYLASTIETYDKGVAEFIKNTQDSELYEDAAQFLGLAIPGAPILEAGCAYGRDANLFTDGHEVIGIDLSKGLLAEARKRYPDITFYEMDVRNLDFENEYFGGIWARAILLHLTLEDMAVALQEFHRVLQSGGVLFLHMKKGSGSKEVDDSRGMTQGVRFFTYVEEDQLKDLLEKNGFEVIKTSVYNGKNKFAGNHRDLWWVDTFAIKK